MSYSADEFDALIFDAETAVVFARNTRHYHARRTARGGKQREADLETAIERLRSAMRPLRHEIAKFPFGPQTRTAESRYRRARKASEMLQRERRKLWKMQARR